MYTVQIMSLDRGEIRRYQSGPMNMVDSLVFAQTYSDTGHGDVMSIFIQRVGE